MSRESDFERVARAIAFLDASTDAQPSLADTAAHVGLSAFHFHRLFARYAGTTPKRFLQFATAAAAQERLAASRPVLAAALDVGLSGPGRLHDLTVSVCALTPGEIGSRGVGLRLRHGCAATPFGDAHVLLSARGVVALRFDDGGVDPFAPERARWPDATYARDDAAAGALLARVFDVPGGGDPLQLHVRGTNLQLRVWEALLRVPEGAVISYGALARRIGRPRAARAVAGAVAANPVAWLIPCHRVLRETGALGGYRWGVLRKRTMLAREWSAAADAAAPL